MSGAVRCGSDLLLLLLLLLLLVDKAALFLCELVEWLFLELDADLCLFASLCGEDLGLCLFAAAACRGLKRTR